MSIRLAKAMLALLLPVALASCVLTPGKFVSTLRIDANRHFVFTYVGEVIGDSGQQSMLDDAEPASAGDTPPTAAQKAARTHEQDLKSQALAEALSKEVGYRKVTYLGDHKYSIDYAISGTLDHAFLYPFNLDAEVLAPFIAIELRGNATARVTAAGYANDSEKTAAIPGAPSNASQLDGTFTIDTDAEIVSQNTETGVTDAGGRKTLVWRSTPNTKAAPTAVLRFK